MSYFQAVIFHHVIGGLQASKGRKPLLGMWEGLEERKGREQCDYNVNNKNKYLLEKYMEVVEPPDYLWWFE